MREIIESLRRDLGEEISKIKIADVRIGVIYTGVLLSTGHGGVAYTPIYEFTTCPVSKRAGEISGTSASDAIRMVFSSNLIEVAVGVASVNALSQVSFEKHPEKYVISNIDVLELISHGDKVSMVGYFGPLIPKVLERTNEVFIFEKRTVTDNRVRIVSPSNMPEILQSSDVILISGSTLVNKTLNRILRFAGKAREVVLLGPTASMIPHPLFRKGITAVMGVKIRDPNVMLRIVSEAGGTQQMLAKCAEKISLLKRDHEGLY